MQNYTRKVVVPAATLTEIFSCPLKHLNSVLVRFDADCELSNDIISPGQGLYFLADEYYQDDYRSYQGDPGVQASQYRLYAYAAAGVNCHVMAKLSAGET